MKKSKQFKPTKATGTSKFAKKSPYLTLEWTEYRNLFLKHNPKCYVCESVARVVDHWQAHKGDAELFWKVDNFIPLCKSCHSIVTALFDRHPIPKTEDKLKWMLQKRTENDVTLKVKVVPVHLRK